jgi:AbrB family looped-hinge helix DNA binding protein
MVRNSYATHVTSKGQVTIPKAIRTRLGLKQGDQLEFVAEDGRTIVRRVRARTNPFSKYVGAMGTFRSRKEVNAWVRELRDPGGR